MAYIGKIPAAAALTSSDIADSIITEAKMADDAISLTELKAGTDGEVISWDASGNPVAIAAGTSGHFLKSQGAGSQPVFAAAGGGKILQVVQDIKVEVLNGCGIKAIRKWLVIAVLFSTPCSISTIVSKKVPSNSILFGLFWPVVRYRVSLFA